MNTIWNDNLTSDKTQNDSHTDCEQTLSSKKLPENINVETVVIGAGMAGILTAYFLKQRGNHVIIVEADTIASGQTGHTTAKITSQHGMIYHKLIHKVGRDRAESYAMAHVEAIHSYERIIEEEQIDCDFEKCPAYLYTIHNKNRKKLRREAKAATSLGIDASYKEGIRMTELPFDVMGGVCFEHQAQFHPVKFINHLAKELEIYEHTKVLSVKKHIVYTNQGNITAQNIVFATHYPIINMPGFYFLRQHQERSYVMALSNQPNLSGMYYSVDTPGLSLRSFGSTLLLGGGGPRTGKRMTHSSCHNSSCDNLSYDNSSCDNSSDSIGYKYLQDIKQTYYPNAEEIYSWSAQDCMSHDNLPFIGRYSVFRPYWYVATGFKKWGMTSAMVAAVHISNHIYGIPNLHENAFAPQRLKIRASMKHFLIDMFHSVIGLGAGIFSSKKRRCPHMGCRLNRNPEENSWDCPCHGSRFTDIGELIDNPAQIDNK